MAGAEGAAAGPGLHPLAGGRGTGLSPPAPRRAPRRTGALHGTAPRTAALSSCRPHRARPAWPHLGRRCLPLLPHTRLLHPHTEAHTQHKRSKIFHHPPSGRDPPRPQAGQHFLRQPGRHQAGGLWWDGGGGDCGCCCGGGGAVRSNGGAGCCLLQISKSRCVPRFSPKSDGLPPFENQISNPNGQGSPSSTTPRPPARTAQPPGPTPPPPPPPPAPPRSPARLPRQAGARGARPRWAAPRAPASAPACAVRVGTSAQRSPTVGPATTKR